MITTRTARGAYWNTWRLLPLPRVTSVDSGPRIFPEKCSAVSLLYSSGSGAQRDPQHASTRRGFLRQTSVISRLSYASGENRSPYVTQPLLPRGNRDASRPARASIEFGILPELDVYHRCPERSHRSTPEYGGLYRNAGAIGCNTCRIPSASGADEHFLIEG